MTKLPEPNDDANASLADADEPSETTPPRSAARFVKPLVLAGLVGVAAVLLWEFGGYLQLDFLATKETQLRSFQADHSLAVFGIAFAIYVIVTGLSLPGAAALSLLYGWYFGFLPALVLVSFASTAGATIAFMTSRYLLRESVLSKFGSRLESFNHHLEEEGAFYLFSLRLIPLVPFFVINLVMGLTPMRARTFWWISQLGMFPGTVVYIYAASRVPGLRELADQGAAAVFSTWQIVQLTAAFALLGLFPLIVKQLLKHVGKSR